MAGEGPIGRVACASVELEIFFAPKSGGLHHGTLEGFSRACSNGGRSRFDYVVERSRCHHIRAGSARRRSQVRRRQEEWSAF